MLSVSDVVGRYYRVDENVIVWMTTLTHVTQAVFEIPAAFLSGLTSLRVGFIQHFKPWSKRFHVAGAYEHLKDVYFDWKWFEFGWFNSSKYRPEFHKNHFKYSVQVRGTLTKHTNQIHLYFYLSVILFLSCHGLLWEARLVYLQISGSNQTKYRSRHRLHRLDRSLEWVSVSSYRHLL